MEDDEWYEHLLEQQIVALQKEIAALTNELGKAQLRADMMENNLDLGGEHETKEGVAKEASQS